MKTKIVTLYNYDELPTESAKSRARDWFREGSFCSDDAWEQVKEDASQVGLRIISLDAHRANSGRFKESAEETAHKIEKEHGPMCETFKTAKAYLEKRDEAVNNAKRDENGDYKDEYALDEKLDVLDAEFLHDLLEDYRIMLEKDIEYRNSDEAVIEDIMANEYTFNESGRRED